MSAIYGIYNQNLAPIPAEALEAMKSSLETWGPDKAGTWTQDGICLGNLLRYNTPESFHEKLPLTNSSGKQNMVFAGRIDNRPDLCQFFHIPETDRPTTPDSALALEAYMHWGDDCPNHLIGDWSLALWDRQRHKLFLAISHHGISSLYYHKKDYTFAFASSIAALLVLPWLERRPNLLFLARVLNSQTDHGELTSYENVFRLPPGCCASVDIDGLRTWRYWKMEETPEVHLPKDDDYVEAFREVFFEAVRCRLRSSYPTGATLSGGLDSGSISVLAAQELGEKGKRLQAFSSLPLYDTGALNGSYHFCDETPFIEMTARRAGNIDVAPVRAEEISLLQGIRLGLIHHQSPLHAASNQYWIFALLEAARQRGIGTLLTGQSGNATISWAGSSSDLLAKLRHGQWLAFRQGLLGAAHSQNISLPRALKRAIINPILPWAKNQVRRRLHRHDHPWSDFSALNPALYNKFAPEQQEILSNYPWMHLPELNPLTARLAIIQPGKSVGGYLWNELGNSHGIEVRDPTTDLRLIRFCLGIPDEQYVNSGRRRWLLRRAMKDLLPEQVLWNPKRGLQAADLGMRLLAEQDEIAHAFEQLEKSSLVREVLDIEKMNNIWTSLQKEVTLDLTYRCQTILLRGMMVGLFLLDF